jgi:hypothetical protein
MKGAVRFLPGSSLYCGKDGGFDRIRGIPFLVFVVYSIDENR